MSFLLHNFYHVNDAWFLGRVGPDAINAMGLFMMVSIANFGFVLTLARGTQSLVGRRFGAGNRDGCQLAMAQGLRLAGLGLVPLGVVEWIAIPDLLRVIGGEGATVDEGVAYVRTLLLFLPFLFFSPLIEFSFQGMGDTKTPFKLQCAAVVVNTGLNWLLVLPHELTVADGALRLDGASWSLPWLAGGDAATWSFGGAGVVGAAAATGASRLVGAVVGVLILLRRERMHRLVAAPSYRADGPVAREILRVGIPAGSSTLLYAVVGFAITKIIGRLDQDALGAYGIGFRGIESLAFMIVLGFGVGTGTVTAHAVGAGDFDRARRSAHVGALLCSAVMLVATILFLWIPRELADVYTDDPAILSIAASYIAFMAFCQVPQALEMVYGDAMAGAGSSALAAVVSIPGNVLRIPLAWWLAVSLDLGLAGVWYAIVASAALKGAGMVVLFLSGAWERGMHKGRGVVGAA